MTQAQIKALIDEKITTNGEQEITGAVLNNVLQAIADACGYTFDIDVYPADAALEVTFYNPSNPDGEAIKINADVSNLGNSKLEAISAWWAAQKERRINEIGGFTIEKDSITDSSPSTLGLFQYIDAGQIIDSMTNATSLIFFAEDTTYVTVNSTDLPYTAQKRLVSVESPSGTLTNVKIHVQPANFVSVSQNTITIGGEYKGEVSTTYDVTLHNSGATFASLEALLSDADLATLIPANVRKGGMTIKFVQSSDNKYVQFRLMAEEFTTDTTQWAIADEGVYVDNPEFIEAKLDGAGHILWAIKADGSIYYGAGVPQQVIDYINEKIAELSLDEYEDIVAFLNGLEKGDKTLQTLLNEKVDKEEGKGLIDAEYASTKSTVNNPEFLEVTTDSEDKVLEGIQVDGTKVIGGDLKVLGNMEVSGVSYKVIENPEYLAAWVDAKDKVIFGFKTDGKTYVGDADFLDDIESIKAFLANFNDKNIDLDALTSITATENPEYIEAKTDSEGKILAGRTDDGAAFENVGFSTPKVSIDGHSIENIEDPEGRTEIKTDNEDKILSYRDSAGVLHEDTIVAKTIKTTVDSATLIFALAQQNYNGTLNRYKSVPVDLPKYGSIKIHTSDKASVVNMAGYTDFSFKCLVGGTENAPYTIVDGSIVFSSDWEKVSYDSSVPDYVEDTLYFAIDPMYHYDDNTGDMIYDWATTKDIHYCTADFDFGSYYNGTLPCTIAFQGASSLDLPKRNFRFKLFKNNSYSKKQKLKIGSLIKASSYNCKAYYRDPDKTMEPVLYRLYKEVRELRPWNEQYPWNIDYPFFTAATGICMNFPVRVEVDGDFYGVMWFGLKKDGDNFMLSDDQDGMILCQGGMYYTWLEFNSLGYNGVDGWDDELNDEITQSNIDAMLDFYDFINNGTWTKENVEERFDLPSWIDYYIFVRVFEMLDNYSHNVMIYSKADKKKMYIFLYDADLRSGPYVVNDIPAMEDKFSLVWKKLEALYHDEIAIRYWQLRNTVLNTQHFNNLFLELQQSIDYSDLNDELEKWPLGDATNATGLDISRTNFKVLDKEFKLDIY